jgi:hypothetical protein
MWLSPYTEAVDKGYWAADAGRGWISGWMVSGETAKKKRISLANTGNFNPDSYYITPPPITSQGPGDPAAKGGYKYWRIYSGNRWPNREERYDFLSSA